MKKNLITTAIALIALASASTSFAAGKSTAFKTADHGTIVKEGSTTTAFNSYGRWVYTIERFSAENLPLDVFKTIRATYGNYYIAGMEKIDVPHSGTVYLVHMQDETSYKTVKITDEGTEIIQEFSRI